MTVQVGSGITELLPRYLDYERKRTPTFARYLLLEHRVYSNEFWDLESSTPKLYWIDPTSPLGDDVHLGLFFHTFVGEDHETISLA